MLKLIPGSALPNPAPITPELQQEVEQFLYREAALLDNREFEDWYDLLTDDIHYYMPTHMPTRYARTRRETAKELSQPDEAALFDEDKASMGLRIRRLATGLTWAEELPSRTHRMVSNVQIYTTDSADQYEVECCCMLYRNRLERQTDIYAGARRDLLRRSDNTQRWVIARRVIVLNQGMLLANNMSVFFNVWSASTARGGRSGASCYPPELLLYRSQCIYLNWVHNPYPA